MNQFQSNPESGHSRNAVATVRAVALRSRSGKRGSKRDTAGLVVPLGTVAVAFGRRNPESRKLNLLTVIPRNS